MNLIHRLELWGDAHHPVWLDILRAILGIVIVAKGLYFVSDGAAVQAIMQGRFGFAGWMSIHYVAFAHLVGGVLIFFGLLTRLAVLFQLPILIGAIVFVNLSLGVSPLNSELWLSILVLALLIVFLIVGSGPLSLDHWIGKQHDY